MTRCHRKYLEARCRERGYQLADVMACVVKQDGDQWTVDETHPAYPRRRGSQPKKPPSTIKKVCSWIKAINRWRKAGKPIRTDAEVANLVAICKRCKHYSTKGRCRACGCAVTKGAWAVMNKARMATEDCPKGEWPLVGASPAEGHSDADRQEHDGQRHP